MASPDTIADLALWLKAGAITGVDGDPVASWPDSSGLSRTASQATAGSRPVLKTGANGLNGKPVVQFDGTDDFLTTVDFTLAQPITYFVVYKQNSTANASNYAFDGKTSGARNLLSTSSGSTTMQVFAGTVVNPPTSTRATTPRVLTVVFNAASSLYSENGNTPDAISSPGTQGIGGLTIGNRFATSGASPLNGYIAEVIVYARALTASERAAVHSYVQDTYAITVADYVASSTAAGTLTPDAPTMSGAAVTFRAVTPLLLLLRPAEQVGPSLVSGTGALAGSGTSLSGTTTSRSTGSGSLAPGPGLLSGGVSSRSAGSGALTSGTSALAASATSRSTGSGALAAGTPTLAGSAAGATTTGAGGLTVTAASMSGAATSTSSGSGSLRTAAAPLSGTAFSRALGTGALVAATPAVLAEAVAQAFVSGALVGSSPALAGDAATFVLVPTPTPPERTVTVARDDRTLRVAAESRVLRVPAEPRAATTAGESRVLLVPAENRELVPSR